jgi:hypothetical protein
MPHGGPRPNSGRKKGTPNRFNIESREKAKLSGLLPLDYMLGVMRDERLPKPRRDEMAKAAAPYLHARLASMQVSGNPDAPLETVTRIERVIIRAEDVKPLEVQSNGYNPEGEPDGPEDLHEPGRS